MLHLEASLCAILGTKEGFDNLIFDFYVTFKVVKLGLFNTAINDANFALRCFDNYFGIKRDPFPPPFAYFIPQFFNYHLDNIFYGIVDHGGTIYF